VRVSQGEAIVEQRNLSSIHLKHGNQVRGVSHVEFYVWRLICMICRNCMHVLCF